MYGRRSKVAVFSLAMLVCGADMAMSQDYPNKPIRIVTTTAGGGTDFLDPVHHLRQAAEIELVDHGLDDDGKIQSFGSSHLGNVADALHDVGEGVLHAARIIVDRGIHRIDRDIDVERLGLHRLGDDLLVKIGAAVGGHPPMDVVVPAKLDKVD